MLALILSPIGRKIGMALAGLALLFGCYRWAYNRGNAAGYGDGQRTQLDLDKQQFQSDRKVFLDTLSAAQKVNDEAKQVIEEKDIQLAQLQSRRDAARKSVAAIPDDKLISDIHRKLGSPETSVGLQPSDVRRIDEILTDYSEIQSQVQVLTEKSAQQDIRISAVEKQRDAAILAYNQLAPLYTKAFNAAQRRRSIWVKIFTLGLVRDKKLDLPAPVTMTR